MLMNGSFGRTTCGLAAAMTVGWLTATARADAPAAPTDEQKAAARMVGTEGVKLALAGDCAGAVDKLTRAEALVHAPTTAVPLGQCEIKLGKLVDGTEILNRVVREALPAGSPKSCVEAKQRAQTLYDATAPRIGKLRIHIDRSPSATGSADVQVAVDGDPVPGVLLDNDRPTDPGPHHVTAQAPGFAQASADVTLADGQTQTVSLRLEANSPGSAGVASPTISSSVASSQVGGAASNAQGSAGAKIGSSTPAGSTTPTSSGPNHVPAFVSFGVGGAGVLVGSIFGIMALSTKASLDSKCGSNKSACPVQSQGDIDSLHTDSIVSNVGWGIGVAGAAVGIILFATAHRAEDTPKSGRIHVVPWLGVGTAGVAGSFQ